MEERKIGKKEIPPKSVVSIVKGPDNPQQADIDAMITRTFDLLGGVKSMITPDMKVILKPNAGHVNYPEESVDTSPEVMQAIVREVKKANPKRIIIAEAGAMGVVTQQAFDASGMTRVAEEEGIELLDLKAEGTPLFNYKVPEPMSDIKQIQLPEILFEEDTFFINVPIMKAHTCCMFTNALKNLKGCVQDHHHYIMHCTNLMGAMYDLGEALVPHLNIADMIRPLEGFGPHSGFPVEYGVIVASTDIIATDIVCSKVASIPLDGLEYLEMARKKPLGNFEDDKIELVGDPLEKVRRHMYVPYLQSWDNWPDYHVHIKNACSSCQSLLSYTLTRIRAMGEYDKHKGLHFVVGRQGELPEEIKPGEPYFLFGDCTAPLKKKLEDSGVDPSDCTMVTGCPPSEPYPFWAIQDHCTYGDLGPVELRRRNTEDLKVFNKWMEAERQRLEAEGELKDSLKVYSAE
jgi:uncharacterized protein (DUF362 family)